MQATGTVKEILVWLIGAALDPAKEYVCEIKERKAKRSLDANAYAWLLMDRIAKHKSIRSSKEEIYLQMLERYGTFVYLPAMVESVEEIKKVFRIVRDRGGVILRTSSGKYVKCRQLQCYKGSSLYDSREMSDLLDGIISEAQFLGIETDTPDEIERMKATWNTGR